VAVYSTVDADSLHVKFADESVCIGPPSPKESYLNMSALLAAAEVTGADAVHPGYGFLAENHQFAQVCADSGVTFIGPPIHVIDQMGNKLKSKEIAVKAGVPTLPSLRLQSKDIDFASVEKWGEDAGFPLIVKASMGGGGRGMKLVKKKEELRQTIELARSESLTAFGSDEIYLEKYLLSPRHIEIQILGDKKGNLIHLGERDCSIQRRHQKLVEESPSPVVSAELRARMGESALSLARKVGYESAGTVEFIVDRDLNYYFLEMNTRIQVEHPVTEMVTGVDLVREQIRVAMGEELSYSQSEIEWKGHAIECRITAEDPRTFAPSPGQISLYHPPGGLGVRVESAACSDYLVTPFYDSMICKLIVYDQTREMALRRMESALREFVIQGIKTSIDFHLELLQDPGFRSGQYDTGFVERRKASQS